MNQLIQSFDTEANKTTTLNGMDVMKSSQSSIVDLFFSFGSNRNTPDNVLPLFNKAANENLDLAIRIALYGRDVRGGMGEREVFRRVIKLVATSFPSAFKNTNLINKIVEVGRWDDLFVLFGTGAEKAVLDKIATALNDGDPLASKWMPREKSSNKEIARKIRNHMGMSSKSYRKMLSRLTNVVEQKMSNNEWEDINYNHVPSVASARYQSAFMRHDPDGYQKWISSLEENDGTAKVNASAIFPHDVIKSLSQGEERVAEQQWKSIPDFVCDGVSFLPMIDTSDSMGVGVANGISAMDVSMGLGLYLAQRNKSDFKNRALSFSENPSWINFEGLSLKQAFVEMYQVDWGFNTDLVRAYREILKVAVDNNVAQEDMPDVLLILSDMQFDSAVRGGGIDENIRRDFEEAGYNVPVCLYWNLNDYGTNTPVSYDQRGVVLVSGFSPAIMESVTSSDLENLTPIKMVLDAVDNERYNWQIQS